jgi:hypothetical protein
MIDSFKGYYKLTEKEFEDLWKNCLFIFDTNIYLDLYRLPETGKKEYLSLLKRLNSRLWVPYNVALEFFRNRLVVINKLDKDFYENITFVEELKQKIEKNDQEFKKRHPLISSNTDFLIKKIIPLLDQYRNKLIEEKEKNPDLKKLDTNLSEIDNLIKDKIGDSYDKQKLDEICKLGIQRYKVECPPGYEDEKKNDVEFYFKNNDFVSYEAKFGDLIIWNQIIDFVNFKDVKNLIFVTADDKEDWWLEFGGKKLGPRPELLQEIFSKTNIERFYLYNSENFLANAKIHLEFKVSEELIQQVIVATQYAGDEYSPFRSMAPKLFFKWLSDNCPIEEIQINNNEDLPDFVRRTAFGSYGYELKYYNGTDFGFYKNSMVLGKQILEANKELDDLTLVFVSKKPKPELFDRLYNEVRKFEKMKIIFGCIKMIRDSSESLRWGFVPYSDVSLDPNE